MLHAFYNRHAFITDSGLSFYITFSMVCIPFTITGFVLLDAKVGYRAGSDGLKCISQKFFLHRSVIFSKSRRIRLSR